MLWLWLWLGYCSGGIVSVGIGSVWSSLRWDFVLTNVSRHPGQMSAGTQDNSPCCTNCVYSASPRLPIKTNLFTDVWKILLKHGNCNWMISSVNTKVGWESENEEGVGLENWIMFLTTCMCLSEWIILDCVKWMTSVLWLMQCELLKPSCGFA